MHAVEEVPEQDADNAALAEIEHDAAFVARTSAGRARHRAALPVRRRRSLAGFADGVLTEYCHGFQLWIDHTYRLELSTIVKINIYIFLSINVSLYY